MSLLLYLTLLQVILVGNAELRNACRDFKSYYLKLTDSDCYYNPDILSSAMSMAARHNYRAETLETVTIDGYILPVFRIYAKGDSQNNKPPIFLQHGIVSNSVSWVDKGSNRSLAFVLADLGYDVFLGNIRGSTYGKEHIYYNNLNPKFWDFNLDTIATNDILSQLELVANVTGKGGSIIYMGHSMGTTMYFMFASAFPERARELIQGGIALAPVVYFPDKLYVKLIALLSTLPDILGFKTIFFHEHFIHNFFNFACPFAPKACLFIQIFVLGLNPQFLAEDLLLFFSAWPSTSSMKQIHQYAQIALSKNFQKFDHGKAENKKIYGSDAPPLYDLKKVTLPTYLFYGGSDFFYDDESIMRLYRELGSDKKSVKKVGNATFEFSHIDFLYAKYLKEYLYEDLVRVIENEFGDAPN